MRQLSMVLFLALAVSASAQTTPMTTEQLQTLKTHVTTSGDLNSLPNNSDGDTTRAALLNASASPVFWVWKQRITRDEVTGEQSDAATNFDWTAFIARSAGERDAFMNIWDENEAVNPSRLNVRQAFTDIFSGAGGAGNRTHFAAIARRQATRFERLYATGTGSTGAPGQAVVVGPVTTTTVQQARELP